MFTLALWSKRHRWWTWKSILSIEYYNYQYYQHTSYLPNFLQHSLVSCSEFLILILASYNFFSISVNKMCITLVIQKAPKTCDHLAINIKSGKSSEVSTQHLATRKTTIYFPLNSILCFNAKSLCYFSQLSFQCRW